jgi:hypothetical protein
MADEGSGLLSMAEYAHSRGVAHRAIQLQVVNGVIKLVDGKVDPAQADASWGEIRRGSRGIVNVQNEAGARSAKSKIAVTLAKLRLLKQRLDIMRERYVDRAEAVAVGEQEAAFVVESLRAAPAAYSATLAAEMGIPDEVAGRILDRFIGLTLVEIGDLPRQAKRDAERA